LHTKTTTEINQEWTNKPISTTEKLTIQMLTKPHQTSGWTEAYMGGYSGWCYPHMKLSEKHNENNKYKRQMQKMWRKGRNTRTCY
jgi:hypothetical protein